MQVLLQPLGLRAEPRVEGPPNLAIPRQKGRFDLREAGSRALRVEISGMRSVDHLAVTRPAAGMGRDEDVALEEADVAIIGPDGAARARHTDVYGPRLPADDRGHAGAGGRADAGAPAWASRGPAGPRGARTARCSGRVNTAVSKHKQITLDTFFQADPPGSGGIIPSPIGDGPAPAHYLDGFDMANVTLRNRVPENVAELFEVAKGAYMYGYLYMPLKIMADHYGILAVEAALYATYAANGGPDPEATMGRTIPFLEQKCLLPDVGPTFGRSSGYHEVKAMRDKLLAHPRSLVSLDLGPGVLKICADLINALYP